MIAILFWVACTLIVVYLVACTFGYGAVIRAAVRQLWKRLRS